MLKDRTNDAVTASKGVGAAQRSLEAAADARKASRGRHGRCQGGLRKRRRKQNMAFTHVKCEFSQSSNSVTRTSVEV